MLDYDRFAELWAKRPDRWSLVIQFIADWHEPLRPDDGFQLGELKSAEEALGCKLPLAVQEWYGLAGRRNDLIASQNDMRDPDQLEWLDMGDGEVLPLYDECQGCAYWAIKRMDVKMSDPPVWVYDSECKLTRQYETFSEMAFTMLVQETALQCNHFNFVTDDGAGLIVERTLPSMGIPEFRWFGPEGMKFFCFKDTIVMMQPSGMAFVAARTKEACIHAQRLFGIFEIVTATEE